MNHYLIGAAAWLAPNIAWAQDAPATVDLPPWAQIALTIIAAAGTYGLKLLRTYVNSLADVAAQKTKLAFLAQLDDVVFTKVAELWQTEVAEAKAAAEDGKLTPEERERFKQVAADWARSLLDAKLLAKLFNGNADKLIEAVVESSVAKLKAVSKPSDPSTP